MSPTDIGPYHETIVRLTGSADCVPSIEGPRRRTTWQKLDHFMATQSLTRLNEFCVAIVIL